MKPALLTVALLGAALITAVPAAASGTGGAATDGETYLPNARMTYSVFEYSIAHADLATCPASFDPERVFCRLAMANEQAHVFVFSYDQDQPLLAIKHYELDDDFLPF